MKKTHYSRRQFIRTTTSAAGAALAMPTLVSSRALAGREYGKPAVLGGEPVRKKPFPHWPIHDRVDEEHLLEALRKDEWCRLGGDITTAFEKKWAELLGVKYATAVVNGTNALYAALNALDVGPGDEVLVPPYTFVATVNAVVQQFALPVFVDTDPETHLMDASLLEPAITEHTRCILPVHLGGLVADMDAISKVAKKHNLPVVEDACQAHFSEWRGKKAGSLGDIGCFSFQASKILPCGEGGAIVTDREDLLDKFHAFQNNGRDRLTGTRHGYQYQGSNLRMTEFQSAILLAQLTRFEAQCQLRERNAKYLTELLNEIPGITPARPYEGCIRATYYIYMMRYDGQHFAGLSRSKFLNALGKEGIPIWSGYVPLNKEPFIEKTLNSRAYQNIYSKERLERYRKNNHCPQNDRLCEVGLIMGQNPLMETEQDVEQIAEAIMKIQTHAEALAKA